MVVAEDFPAHEKAILHRHIYLLEVEGSLDFQEGSPPTPRPPLWNPAPVTQKNFGRSVSPNNPTAPKALVNATIFFVYADGVLSLDAFLSPQNPQVLFHPHPQVLKVTPPPLFPRMVYVVLSR